MAGTAMVIHPSSVRGRLMAWRDTLCPCRRAVRFTRARCSNRIVFKYPARPAYAGLRSIPHTVERSQRSLPVRVDTPSARSQRVSSAIENWSSA